MDKDTVYTTSETNFIIEIQSLKSKIKSMKIDLKKKEHQSLTDCFDFTNDDFDISSSNCSSSTQPSDVLSDNSPETDKFRNGWNLSNTRECGTGLVGQR